MNDRDWFELDDKGIVKLKATTKAVPEIQALLKDKNAEKYWGYIWNLVSYKSPYSNYPESERAIKVADDFLGGISTNENLLKATTAYRFSIETVSMRLHRAANLAALSVARYFEDAAADPEADVEAVMDGLGKIGKIIESLDKLGVKVQKEITNDETIRGGGSVRTRER